MYEKHLGKHLKGDKVVQCSHCPRKIFQTSSSAHMQACHPEIWNKTRIVVRSGAKEIQEKKAGLKRLL